MKQNIQTLNLKTVKRRTSEDEVNFYLFMKELDLSYILDLPFAEGLEKAKDVAGEIVKEIKDNKNTENGLTIILNCVNEDTFGLAEAMIGHIVTELVNRDKLRVPDRYLGLATFDDADKLTGGSFNLLSLINYESGFDFIKIVALNEDHTEEKGLGVRE